MARYACTDLHGNYFIWTKIKEKLKPEDTLIFIGDAADRGLQGWQIIKELLDRPNTIYIRGNHEQMLIDRFPEDNHDAAMLHEYNGGVDTYRDMINDPNRVEYMAKLNNTPLYYETTNIKGQKVLFTHSGSTNLEDKDDLLWSRWFWKNPHYPTGDYTWIIHGHTPMIYIQDSFEIERVENKPFKYNNKFICIDNATYYTNISILLNIDDFSYQRIGVNA